MAAAGNTSTQGTTGNPYLGGNFGPVHEEHIVVDLPVTGDLPDWLDGRYLRNGPNPIGSADPATYNWFLGTGMIHGLRVRDGRAEWYRNRFVRSQDVAATLGEPARPGPVHAGMDFAANTHVIGHAGRTFALVEAGPLPYELDAELGTIGSCDFDGTLPGGYTAHPLRDPATGELHAVSYFWGWGNKVQYSVLGTDGRIRRTVDIEVSGSPMMHAFSLTERYVVIYDLPVTFDVAKVTPLPAAVSSVASKVVGRLGMPNRLASRLASSPSVEGFPYTWNPSYPARVGVLPREGTAAEVRWFDIEPCFVYHPLNAYDEGDGIVLDVTRHPSTFATEHHGPNEGTPTLDRWTIDLSGGKVREERLDDRGHEFPRLDDRLVGRRHRYGYAVAFDGTGDEALVGSGLIKHDFAGGDATARSFGPGTEVDEFVFVPSSPSAPEDDGVLMGFVYDGSTDRSALVVLDAGTLEDRGRVDLPSRVPHGFHGSWIPD